MNTKDRVLGKKSMLPQLINHYPSTDTFNVDKYGLVFNLRKRSKNTFAVKKIYQG